MGTLAFTISAATFFLIKEPKRKLKSLFAKKEEVKKESDSNEDESSEKPTFK